MAYPLYQMVRSKEGLRLAVREILVCIPIATCLLYFVDHSVFFSPELFMVTMFLFGIPCGIILWAAYRILRFALGDMVHPVYRTAKGILLFVVIVACALYFFLRFNGFPTF